ncbi:MAG: VapC toxin family PIN domain ribonuclease [Zetaproteobacteria bacterium CG02_land_8_20_14_3_00_50_9]|jgi:predicted nucleic acid-binding protein|nr:MAG: VapC toxin family PIN domain ribonuclease [Zetaproteobacteria bacterium CG02_land_8_20_14_3_00_50_9]
MSAKFFLDTNIVVYTFDAESPQKKRRAQELVEQALRTHEGVVSTQVVQEFLNVATVKFTAPLKFSDAQQFLHDVLAPLCTVFPSIDLFQQALVLQQETKYSFYDSLIIGGALQAGCETLYSEDLQHGQQIRGVRILNPFTSS